MPKKLTLQNLYDYVVDQFYCIGKKLESLVTRDAELQTAIENLEAADTTLGETDAAMALEIDALQAADVVLTNEINALKDGAIVCRTFGQFQSAIELDGPQLIRLGADIEFPGSLVTIPADKNIDLSTYQFVSTGFSTIAFYGQCVAERRQIFDGFAPGDIKGTFGRESIYPEWWGLQDGRHDIAINSAIKASPLQLTDNGLTISLAARTYEVARPIDLAGSASTLLGAGSNHTRLLTTSAWIADPWIKSEVWGDPSLTTPNHAAVVWIGAELGSAFSYRTKVIGMDINCYAAAFANRATHRVSGISAKGGVEECSLIHDVLISAASGFGIGFCRHKNADFAYQPATVNGLEISNFWIITPTFRDSWGIYSSIFTNNLEVRSGTIGLGLHKSSSSAYGDVGGGDPTIYPEPEWIMDYAFAAINAQGRMSIRDVHIEGTVVGVHLLEGNGINNISIQDLKCFGMMDAERDAVYFLDGLSGAEPPSNTDNYGYGCAALISGKGPAAFYPNDNWADRATVNNICSLGTCCYLVRDSIYGVELTTFDMGQFPAGEIPGGLTSYLRGNAWVVPGSSVYDKLSPATDRTYFLGPIY